MTYGEAYTTEKFSLELIKGIWVKTIHIDNKPARMSRDDAARYYTDKINKEFKRLGYVMNRVKYIPEFRVLGFDSVEDMFDYYEAEKFREELMSA